MDPFNRVLETTLNDPHQENYFEVINLLMENTLQFFNSIF